MNRAFEISFIGIAISFSLLILGAPNIKSFSEPSNDREVYSVTIEAYQLTRGQLKPAKHHPFQIAQLNAEFEPVSIDGVIAKPSFTLTNIPLDNTVIIMPDPDSGSTKYTYAVRSGENGVQIRSKVGKGQVARFFLSQGESVEPLDRPEDLALYEVLSHGPVGDYSAGFRRKNQKAQFSEDGEKRVVQDKSAIGFISSSSAVLFLTYDSKTTSPLATFRYGKAVSKGGGPAVRALSSLGILPQNLTQ